MFNQMPYMMSGIPLAQSTLNGASGTKAFSFLGKINWSSLLSNAQKTLNVVNQAIPLYYQVKPAVSNIRTLGKIGKELTKSTTNETTNIITNNNNNNVTVKSNEESNNINDLVPNPTFFI